jgi:hypothetical protein
MFDCVSIVQSPQHLPQHTPALIGGHFEGSFTEKHAHRGTRKEHEGGQCVYFCHITACTKKPNGYTTGVRWCTRAENGGKLFLGHHVA